MGITSYEYNRLGYEGQLVHSSSTVMFGVPKFVARPNLVAIPDFPQYLGNGRVVSVVGYEDDSVQLAQAFNDQPVGVVPTSFWMKRQQLRYSRTISAYLEDETTTDGLPSGFRVPLLTKGFIYMYSENTLELGSGVFYRYSNVNYSLGQDYGRLTSLDLPGETAPLEARVIQGNSNPSGGTVLVHLNLNIRF